MTQLGAGGGCFVILYVVMESRKVVSIFVLFLHRLAALTLVHRPFIAVPPKEIFSSRFAAGQN